jgi:hypothetical protein
VARSDLKRVYFCYLTVGPFCIILTSKQTCQHGIALPLAVVREGRPPDADSRQRVVLRCAMVCAVTPASVKDYVTDRCKGSCTWDNIGCV